MRLSRQLDHPEGENLHVKVFIRIKGKVMSPEIELRLKGIYHYDRSL